MARSTIPLPPAPNDGAADPGDTDNSLKDQGWPLFWRLMSYLPVYRMAFLAMFIGYIIFGLTGALTAWWLQETLDAIAGGDLEFWRIMSPLLCIGIAFTRGVGGFLGSYSIAYIANNIVHKLRMQLLDRLLALPVAYYDRNASGRLVSKVTYDVAQITGAATNAVAVMLREGLFVIALLSYLIYIDWQLCLAFLVVAPIVAQIVSLASKRFRRYSTQMQNSMGDVTQITSESIKGHHVVRTFNAKDFVLDRFGSASNSNRRQNMKMATTQAVSTPIIQLIVSMALAVLIWLAMSPDFYADKTPGMFIAFVSASAMLAKPIRQLSQINSVIQRGVAAADSIFSLLDEEPEDDQGEYSPESLRGELEFNDVSFAYNADAPVLSAINFKAEPGQTIALVGKSGSGKSSLVGLIPRFYSPSSGSITLDGVELADYQLEFLRTRISLVSQQVVLFNGSIAENIAYGEDPAEIDLTKVREAAKSAHALDFIEEMPEGFNTQVGDDAKLLSGGQRQRIAIARALLKDTPILILDEATSALDSESEKHIQEALEALMKGRTTFVIAHRLSTIENADVILVMDDGKIVESGSHKELIGKNGYYARLHRIQFADAEF